LFDAFLAFFEVFATQVAVDRRFWELREFQKFPEISAFQVTLRVCVAEARVSGNSFVCGDGD
jgi:hypothetical protein